MAVIQISKIQVRRGAVGDEGMPQLASGEFGWAIDTQQLFIGNGAVSEGAPAVGNTEILTISTTATTNIFNRFLNDSIYLYKGVNSGTTITTGLELSPRTVQRKLDETVTVLDFGATDRQNITTAIARAVRELYNNTDSIYESSRRILRIPAGKYYSTGIVDIPPYATIVGDGAGKTIIVSSGNTVFRTTSTGATNIEFKDLTLEYSTTTNIAAASPLIVINNANATTVEGCTFKGGYILGGTNNKAHAGIKLTGASTVQTNIEGCIFDGTSHAVDADDDVEFTNINENLFANLYKGITFGVNSTGSGNSVYGPRRTKVTNNTFKRIAKQAVVNGTSARGNIVTSYQSVGNLFYDVGSDFTNDQFQSTSVIDLYGINNVSVNDKFNRFANSVLTYTNKKFLPLISGTCSVAIDEEFALTMSTGTTARTLVRVPYASTMTNLTVDYVMNKAGRARNGHFVALGSPAGVTYKDSYSYVGADDGAVILTAELVDTETLGIADSLAVKYTNTVNTGTISLTIRYQQ
jgi:hypothetical protein